MTTHNHPDEDARTEQDSHSTSAPGSAPESIETKASAPSESNSTPQPPRAHAGHGPSMVQAKPFVSAKAPKPKMQLMGLGLLTSGLSLGAVGCGFVLAKGPFAELAARIEPLTQRGLTGGSMVLTGVILTAMALVERQLRKQGKAIESQEANAAILQDIFGSMATIQNRFDELQSSERVIYAEANMMRNELHQFVASQAGKDEQTGIFHVAASVDKLSAQVDRTLKGFGSDLQEKLRMAQEQTQATNAKLESKLNEFGAPERQDNSEWMAAQSELTERLESMQSQLSESRSEWSQMGDRIQTNLRDNLDSLIRDLKSYDDVTIMSNQAEICERLGALERNLRTTHERLQDVNNSVQEAVQEQMNSAQPQPGYDDTAVRESQIEIAERLGALEENLRATHQRLQDVGNSVQEAVQEQMRSAQSQPGYDDTAVLVGQSEIAERLCAMEENLRQSQERVDRIGDEIQSAVLESIQSLPSPEAHDDSALLASQTEIVDRLKDLEARMDSTRTRFDEVQAALEGTLREALSDRTDPAMDSRIENLRAELEQVSETVEAAVKCALENAPSLSPSAPVACEPSQLILESQLSASPKEPADAQAWPLQGPTKSQGLEVQPPLEILHMPTQDEMKSAVSQDQDKMALAMNHLFQPVAPEDALPVQFTEELFRDYFKGSTETPQGPDVQMESPSAPNQASPYTNLPVAGTPGSPFPAPVPLKPTESGDTGKENGEGPHSFNKPYEPPSDGKGFRFPGWKK